MDNSFEMRLEIQHIDVITVKVEVEMSQKLMMQ